MQGFDLSTISNCYIGGAQASAIYLGSNKIWPATQHDYSQDPLTFEVLEAGQFKFKHSSTNTQPMSYSLDNGTHWTVMQDDTWTATIPAGSKMIFDCYEPAPADVAGNGGIGRFSSTGRFNVSGNIGSILEGYMGMNQTYFSLATAQFAELFYACTHLISAEHLYLPPETIIGGCYRSMFSGCSSLTKAPALPATTLAEACYDAMFARCSSLTSAPELPATTLAQSCYLSMFAECTSLTTAPALPATTLAPSCYYSMFAKCTSLTSAPALPATTLPTGGVVGGCYQSMFSGCTSLTSAPALPATTLSRQCYTYMFSGCRSLTTAPALPATTLAQSCYNSMFRECTSLTTAPDLPATTLANFCYYEMFNGCYHLNSVTCLATDISASQCTYNWLNGVSATGTFTKAASMNDWTTGASGIPSGWTTVNAS